MDTTQEVFKYLVLTQIASDAGKGIDSLYSMAMDNVEYKEDVSKAFEKGYKIKDKYLLKALANVTSSEFTYFITKKPDQNGYESIIVLFEYVDKQIAFHIPWKNPIAEYVYGLSIDNTNPNFVPIKWNGIIGGSRQCLIDILGQ